MYVSMAFIRTFVCFNGVHVHIRMYEMRLYAYMYVSIALVCIYVSIAFIRTYICVNGVHMHIRMCKRRSYARMYVSWRSDAYMYYV